MPDILQIAPAQIQPDPDNPRKKLRDIPALSESIKEHGVLEAITVRPNGTGDTWIVVRGHRRHAAALMAKVETIPCIVSEELDDKQRAVRRMVENLQRDDLSPLEHTRGIQQLFDLGLTEDEIGIGLSVPTVHIRDAHRIAQSEVATAIAEKHDLSFDQALALAEFDDDKEIVKQLSVTAIQRPQDFDHRVERFRQARDERVLIEAKSKEMAAKGYKILENDVYNRPGDGVQTRIHYLKANKEAKTTLNARTHAKCPGRAVYVDTDWNGKIAVEEICTDWPANGHVSDVSLGSKQNKDSRSEKQIEAARVERRETLACNKAGRAAEPVRRKFVRELLQRTIVPKGTERYVTTALLTRFARIDPWPALFSDLTGVPDGQQGKLGTPEERFIEKLPDGRVVMGLLAFVAANVERTFEPNTWRSSSDERKAYLRFLISAGYSPALIEKVIIGEAQPSEVVEAAERLKGETAHSPDQGSIKGSKPAKISKPVKKAVRRRPARAAVAK